MDIVHQLGELFLGAVPTVVLILIFYFILKSLFFKPLLAVMAEREARSIGARKAAEVVAARRDMEPHIAQLASEIAARVLQPAREAR